MVNWKTKLVNWGPPGSPWRRPWCNEISILNTKNAVRLKTRTTRVGVVLFLERTLFHVFKINIFMRLYFMRPADTYGNVNSLVGNAELEEYQKQRFHMKKTSASGKYKLLP